MSVLLSGRQIDSLRELGTAAMAQAAAALAQMLGEPVRLRSAQVSALPALLPELADASEGLSAGVAMGLEGDIRGEILIGFSRQSTLRLLFRLLGREEPDLAESELGGSALREVGNILASAYLTALGEATGLLLLPTVPSLLENPVCLPLSMTGERVLVVEAGFFSEGRPDEIICGHFFLFSTGDFLERLLRVAPLRL